MRSFFSILACFVLSGLLHAQVQLPVQWVKQYGYTDEEYAFGIAADDSSNVFVTGLIGPGDSSFHNKAQCANHDIFVARYDAQGNSKWLYKMGAFGTDIGWGITVDKDHNICTASSFQDQLILGADTVTSVGFMDILITKFNAQGDLLWARSAGGILDDEAYSIRTDSHNNIYITGIIEDTAHFGSGYVVSKGHTDVFIAKYDPAGNLKWVINAGGSATGEDGGAGISIDPNDNIYVTGKFSDTAVFSTQTLIARGNSDAFVAKYDTAGTLQWIRSSGGTSVDLGQGIYADGNGSVFTTGYFWQTAFFGNDSLLSAGGSDAFVSKYDAQGNLAWTKSAGGSGNDEGASVVVNKNNIYFAGYFAGTASFGPQTASSMGLYDAFLSSIDTAGNFHWVKPGGGTGMDAASAICADTAGAVYMAGIFDYICKFDTLTDSCSYDENFFVAKFALNAPVVVKEISYNNDPVLFPNPSHGTFTVLFAETNTEVGVKILNAVGEVVLATKVIPSANGNPFDLSGLSKGVYLVFADISGKVIHKKVVIE